MAGWLLLVLLPLLPGVAAGSYNTSSSRDPNKLNVHIISHSHDDAGWLKTVDQYYYGSNQSIQVAGVQYVFDSVVQSLQANPDRRFTLCEQAFFTRWWHEQGSGTRSAVRRLVQSGQLDVWNGGWVQHDEAAAHYAAMVDQTTRGHRFLKRELGVVPRVAFQADPFGHSSTHAALLSARAGFDALIFGRADYQDTEVRRRARATELLWRGAESFGGAADVFTINLDGYWPVPGFWWDWGGADEGINDDPLLEGYNVHQRVQDFFDRVSERFGYTRGNDVLLTMGSDFHYANAHYWYKNLDKLIHYANLDGRLNVFYSSAGEYVDAKAAYGGQWPLKTDDFFPYADNPHSYWTGYFTSRPTSKGYIRMATSYLQAARQLELLVAAGHPDLAGVAPTTPSSIGSMGAAAAADGGSVPWLQPTTSQQQQNASQHQGREQQQQEQQGQQAAERGWPSTDALWAAVSLTQHHDAITGTEKQHVANDYHRRLARGKSGSAWWMSSAAPCCALSQSQPFHPVLEALHSL